MKNYTTNQLERVIETAKEKKLSVYFEQHRVKNPMFIGLVGIETKSSVVYWFEYTEDGYLNYNHTYNCKNGTSAKKYALGYKFLKKMLYN